MRRCSLALQHNLLFLYIFVWTTSVEFAQFISARPGYEDQPISEVWYLCLEYGSEHPLTLNILSHHALEIYQPMKSCAELLKHFWESHCCWRRLSIEVWCCISKFGIKAGSIYTAACEVILACQLLAHLRNCQWYFISKDLGSSASRVCYQIQSWRLEGLCMVWHQSSLWCWQDDDGHLRIARIVARDRKLWSIRCRFSTKRKHRGTAPAFPTFRRSLRKLWE